MEEIYKNAIKEFNKYTKQYSISNDMISLKYYHTFRVAHYAKSIAKSGNLNDENIYIAFLCGLLHDIARFKQATQFNTFNDYESFDHGDMGYKILKENNYISKYIQNKESQEIILKAVKNHNKFEIEKNLNKKELLFAKLIRDADKIDILVTQRNEINDNSTTIDKDVLQAFKAHKLFKSDGTKRNDATEMVKYLCFVYDLNFKRSFEIIKEKGIIEKKLNVLKQHISKENIDLLER